MTRGFTLLEMIVALGVFAVAATIATSSLLSLTDAQKKAFALQNTYDNLRFSLETMAKDIRTGDSYYCGGSADDIPSVASSKDCSAGGAVLTYKNFPNKLVSYRLANGRIEKLTNGALDGALTAGDVFIERFTFYVLGSLPSSSESIPEHPRVTIVVEGVAGSGRSASRFNLETTVAQRQVSP